MATDSAARAGETYIPGWTFGDKLRKARRISGLDQRDFAARLNLTASTVAAYEGDRATPRLRDASQLAKSLQVLTGIEASWFLDFDAPTGGGSAFFGVSQIRPRTVGRIGLEPMTDGSWVAPVTPIRKAG